MKLSFQKEFYFNIFSDLIPCFPKCSDFTIYYSITRRCCFEKGKRFKLGASFRGSLLTEAGHQIVNFLAKGNWFTLDFSPVITLFNKGTTHFQSDFMKFLEEEKNYFPQKLWFPVFYTMVLYEISTLPCCWSNLYSNLANGRRLDYLCRKRESLSKAGNGNRRTSVKGKEDN